MAKGTIRKLIEGSYGFIKSEQEKDFFFHRTDLVGVEFYSLKEGQEVEFEESQGRDGRPKAVNVRLTETQTDDDGDDSGDDGSGDNSE